MGGMANHQLPVYQGQGNFEDLPPRITSYLGDASVKPHGVKSYARKLGFVEVPQRHAKEPMHPGMPHTRMQDAFLIRAGELILLDILISDFRKFTATFGLRGSG